MSDFRDVFVVESDQQDLSAPCSRSDLDRNVFSNLAHAYVGDGMPGALCLFDRRVDFVAIRADQSRCTEAVVE